MPQISKDHHYIPICFIERFFEDNSVLWAYSKELGKILQRPKTAKTIFFETHRNTISTEMLKPDMVEGTYGVLDNMLAKYLDKICRTPIDVANDPFQFTGLSWLLASFWYRVPAHDNWAEKQASNYIDNNPAYGFGDMINQINTFDLNESDKNKLVRSVASCYLFLSTFRNKRDEGRKIVAIENIYAPFLLSDSPVIFEKEPNAFHELTEDFVLPFTSTRAYLGTKGNRYNFDSKIAEDINILSMLQAQRYFCSNDKPYLEYLVSIYEGKKEINIDLMKIELFERINKSLSPQ